MTGATWIVKRGQFGQNSTSYVPSGFAVWEVIRQLMFKNWDAEKTLEGEFKGAFRRHDIDYAMNYYIQHKAEVDAKIHAAGFFWLRL